VRSVSDQAAKTWPGAKLRRVRPPARVCKWDIHKELEDLVVASNARDSDEEDEEKVNMDDRGIPDLGQRSFHLRDIWQGKSARQVGRERRTKSEGTARRPEMVQGRPSS
jgi:hypothetical protein